LPQRNQTRAPTRDTGADIHAGEENARWSTSETAAVGRSPNPRISTPQKSSKALSLILPYENHLYPISTTWNDDSSVTFIIIWQFIQGYQVINFHSSIFMSMGSSIASVVYPYSIFLELNAWNQHEIWRAIYASSSAIKGNVHWCINLRLYRVLT
jgi:hypothetical protein